MSLTGLFALLAGCEKSAQEKVAEEQLKAIDLNKNMTMPTTNARADYTGKPSKY
jgi:hypothetical protein